MNKRSTLPGLIISAVLVVLSVLFMFFLFSTYLLPWKILLLIGALLLIVCGGVLLLTAHTEKKLKFIIGCVLTVISVTVMVLGFLGLRQLTSTIRDMTHNKTEVAQVSVFVKADDPAQNLDDAAGYTFCILKELDRESVDLTIVKINEELNITVPVEEYDVLVELVNAVLDGENKAMVISADLLNTLTETELYGDLMSKLREIAVKHIEIQVPQGPLVSVENKPDGVFQMYICGIDRFGSVNSRSRSDVNIIATVNTNTHEILLVTTPRDYYVPLPISNGVPDKLTHAGIYGVDVSMGTLEMLYDIDIDYFFRVNFTGFSDIIDAIGGVEVYSDRTFSLSDRYYFYEGYNHMDGETALVFARTRRLYGDSYRANNQMEVIKAVINKLSTSTALLENYMPLMESIGDSFQCSMSYETIAGLVRHQIDNMESWHVTTYAVKGTGTKRVPYSSSVNSFVYIPNEKTVEIAKQKMQAVINGEILE